MTDTLREFLLKDPLSEFHFELIDEAIEERLGRLLDEEHPARLVRSLHPFVVNSPWRYWSNTEVADALRVLEANPERTARAINERRARLDRAVQNLFRPAPASQYEESYNHVTSGDLIRIATEFVPDYLRWAEQIYGNLLSLYWSVNRKGGVDAKFSLKKAAQHFRDEGPASLVTGFHEKIRNAIAHGEFQFTGTDIAFGATHPRRCSSVEFLREYDELCRTSNACALALFLFWGRHDVGERISGDIPVSIVGRVAGGGLNRPGLKLAGVVESSIPGVGRQLHIAIQLDIRERTQVFGQAARVATHLLDAGAVEFDRYVIEIDHGEEVSSFVALDPLKLQSVLDQELSADQLSHIFEHPTGLWFDEGRWMTRVRGWKIIAKSTIEVARKAATEVWIQVGLRRGKGQFRVREVENLSVDGNPRVRIRAVLRDPEYEGDRELVREIMWELVKLGRRRIVASRPSALESGISLPRRPQHVIVDLFREDGTLRWLKGGGWIGGNLVAVGERTWGGRPHIQVTEPEETYEGIALRYEINREEAAKALRRAQNFVNEIRCKRGLQKIDWEDV